MATRPHGSGPDQSHTRGTLSRRQLLLAVGGGVLALSGEAALRAGAFGQQVDATPPAAPVSGVTGAPSVADKAAELAYDIEKIFRFVADEIRYERYSGALRGATGTLWSRAGNSVDKALLLASLLDAAMATYRFALGPLDAPTVKTLLDASLTDAATARTHWAETIDAMLATIGPDGQPVAPKSLSLTPQQDKDLKNQFSSIGVISTEAGKLLETRVNAISGALRQAGISLPPLPDASLPAAERDRHAWVQLADGPAWVDLDPSLSGTKQGQALTKPAAVGSLPDDLHHRVRFSVVVEEITGGQPQRRETTFFEAASADLINVPVCMFIAPRGDLKGLGNAINQAIGGKASLVPTFFTGKGGSYADTAITFGVSGGGFAGALGGTPASGVAEGEALGLWLNVDIAAPDHDPVHVERTLFDRVDAATRANGKVDPQAVAPVDFVQSADGSSTVRGLQSMWIYTVDGAYFPAVLAGADPITARIFGGLQLLPQGYSTLRASLMLEQELSRGFRSFVDMPNVVGFTISQDTAPPSIRADLLSQRPAVAALRGASTPGNSPHPLLVAGVTNQIAEQFLFAQPSSNDGGAAAAMSTPPAATAVTDVGSVLAAVESQGIAWRIVTGPGQVTGLPAQVALRLRTVLSAGQVVVLPARPVALAGIERYAWWVVDPRSGRTYDQLDDGSGSAGRSVHMPASLAGPLGEDITIVERIPAGAAEGYRRLAICVAAVCASVSMQLAFLAAGVGYATATTGWGKIGAALAGASAAVGGVGAGIGVVFACG